MTLTEFLLARIAEDEGTALYAQTHGGLQPEDWGGWWFGHQQHYSRYDPARVLAECEAKRQLIRMAYAHGATVDGEWGCCHDVEALQAGGRAPAFDGDEFEPLPADCLGARGAHKMLNVIALPYADHPDYRQEWKP